MSRRSRKRDRKLHSFVALEMYVIESAAYRDLSPVARAALVEVLALYRGDNNGSLVVPVEWLAERLGKSKATASRALSDLDDHGLVKPTSRSSFSDHRRRAAEYRVTFRRDDRSGHLPSKEFLTWTNSPVIGVARQTSPPWDDPGDGVPDGYI